MDGDQAVLRYAACNCCSCKVEKRYKKKEVLAAEFHINFATDNCINENTQKKY